MADNTRGGSESGTAPLIATDEVTYSGDTADVQLFRPVHVTGAEGSKTVGPITNDFGIFSIASDAVTSNDGRDDEIAGMYTADGSLYSLSVFPWVFNGTTWDRMRGNTQGLYVINRFSGGTEHYSADDLADGETTTENGMPVVAPWVFNGTTWDRLRGDTAGLYVGGNVAHDAADSGNPVKIGGIANSTNPAVVTAGDRVNGNFNLLGALMVGIAGPNTTAGSDATNLTQLHGQTGSNISTPIGSGGYVFNGTTWDRLRSGGSTGMLGVAGAAAHASPTSGNPVYVAGRASNAIPTDVGADGDAAGLWTNRHGASMVSTAPHIGLNGDPWSLVHETAQYTTTQTSTVLVAGGASEKIVVTKVQIQAGGTTAGTVQLYFGTGAYSRGTSRAIFDGEFAPSSTLKPGVIMDGPFIAGTNGDDLMVTDSAAINPLTITVWYYVIT